MRPPKSGLPARRLEIDIMESVLFDDDGRNLETMHQLKKLGTAIALDDFGVGYSSLNNLTIFPFDKIKIDRSFISKMTKSPGMCGGDCYCGNARTLSRHSDDGQRGGIEARI